MGFITTETGDKTRTVDGGHAADWAGAPESFALGWAPDGRAIVTEGHGLCGVAAETPGVYLLDPVSGDLELIVRAAVGDSVKVWRVRPTGAVNDAEHLIVDALDGLGLEGCCSEPSHGGPSATTGAVYDGARLPISGTPTDVWLERADPLFLPQSLPLGPGEATLHDGGEVLMSDNRMLTFHCGEFTWTIGWWEDELAEVDSMLLLAEALLPTSHAPCDRPPENAERRRP
jgi:hypothetical protein